MSVSTPEKEDTTKPGIPLLAYLLEYIEVDVFFGARFRVPSYHVDQSHLYAFFHPASGRNQCAKFRGWVGGETRVLQTDPPSCLYFYVFTQRRPVNRHPFGARRD